MRIKSSTINSRQSPGTYKYYLNSKYYHKKCELLTVMSMIVKDLLENNEDNIAHVSKQYLNIGVVVGQESAAGERIQYILMSNSHFRSIYRVSSHK